MTQREVAPSRPLPLCPSGHSPRCIFDARRFESKGGFFVECRCSVTPKCPSFDLAWAHWHKMHGIQPVATRRACAAALPQLQLRLLRGAGR